MLEPGPLLLFLADELAKLAPDPCGATWTSYWLLMLYRDRAHISAILSMSVLMAPSFCSSAMKLLNEKASNGGSFGSSCSR